MSWLGHPGPGGEFRQLVYKGGEMESKKCFVQDLALGGRQRASASQTLRSAGCDLGQVNISELQLSHLQSEDNSGPYFVALL